MGDGRGYTALLAGGGTGGHVFPALAVGRELLARGWKVTLTGSDRGLEARLAKEQGIDFIPLPALPFVGKGRLAQGLALLTLGRSGLTARGLVQRLGAHVVLGTGGYASVPALLGARLAKRPALLLEINARAGEANRRLSRHADEALLAFKETAGDLACPCQVTGTPIRPAFFDVKPLRAHGGGVSILVLGGSQGARQLNELVPAALVTIAREVHGLNVVHQCGQAHVAAAQEAYVAAPIEGSYVKVTPFLDDVAGAMAAADLILCRAGAMTVAEIAAAGRPAIFVPMTAAAAHQVDNARQLAEAGAAKVLLPAEASAERLAALIQELLAERKQLPAMGEAARRLARRDAAERIAERMESWAASGVRRKSEARLRNSSPPSTNAREARP